MLGILHLVFVGIRAPTKVQVVTADTTLYGTIFKAVVLHTRKTRGAEHGGVGTV